MNVLKVVLCFRILSIFPTPHKIILKLMFLVLGTSLLPSARCAEQVHPRIAFALGLKPGPMETGLLWKYRLRLHGRGDGVRGGLGPRRPSFPRDAEACAALPVRRD